jgi:glycosyltransferase involved in cell wall biosynthesis
MSVCAKEPCVSVIIPTYRRPHLVKRAIASALNQTLHTIEVIVVINGETDGATRAALAELEDPRLRILELPVNLGCPAPARNFGVEQARAPWIAHLDDDDEWFPEKLERQYAAACQSPYSFPVVTCCLKVLMVGDSSIQPRRLPDPGEAISDYLFVRRSFFQGEGIIQGSSIFTSKALMERVPFNPMAKKHEDWEWILQVAHIDGVGIEFIAEPLSVWHLDHASSSMSRTHDWQPTLDWARSNRSFFTRRAYSSFLLIEIASHAAFNRDWHVFMPLLQEAIAEGAPRPLDYLLFFGMWILSPSRRNWLRTRWNREEPRRLGVNSSLELPFSP